MSAERRKKILIGFGGTAVVLAAAVVFLSPSSPYRSEDASGAIGAVQKHRAPQIKQQDVVLGDEQAKQQQQVLYADYLKDAAVLQNISNELGTFTVDAKWQPTNVVYTKGSGAQAKLEAQSNDLQARFIANAENALDSFRKLSAISQDYQKQAELGKAALESASLGHKGVSTLANAGQDSQLGHAAEAEAQLGKMIADLGVRKLEAKDYAALQAQVLASASPIFAEPCCGGKLRQKSLESMNAAMEASARLKGASQFNASANLTALDNAINTDNLASKLRQQADYLGVMAKQAANLEAANRNLAAKSYEAAARELSNQADALESAALANMNKSMLENAAAAESLGSMMRQAESLANRDSEMGAFALGLKDQNAKLQANGRFALAAQLNAADQYLGARGNKLSNADQFASYFNQASQMENRKALASASAGDQNLGQRALELATSLQARKRE